MQAAQEMHHVGCLAVGLLNLEMKLRPLSLRGKCDGTDHGESRVAIPRIEYGSLTARSPSAAAKRLQHKAAFIEEDNASSLLGSLF